MGCASCTAGLGAVRSVTTEPFRRTITPSAPAGQYGTIPSSGAYGSYVNGAYSNSAGAAQTNRTARRTQAQQQANTNVNTAGAPSTISHYDAYGNPVYSVPPPGQQVTGYDAAGTPLYGASSGSQPASSILQTSAITGYDAAGTPIYSAAPPGQTIVGYDNYGNPIYSGSAASSALLTSSAAGSSSAPASTSSAAMPAESDYQTLLDYATQDTFISGVPNWVTAGGLFVAFMLLKAHLSGGRH